MQTAIDTPQRLVAALKKYPSLKALSRGEGLYWKKAHKLYVQAVNDKLMEPLPIGRKPRDAVKPKPTFSGQVKARKSRAAAQPAAGEIKRYLFTCAQNSTKVHKPMWTNLLALADYYAAEIHVSRFTYSKSGLGAQGDKLKAIDGIEKPSQGMWWDDETFGPYYSDDRMVVAPGLVWCGEMNMLPTAVRPLSGLESYTGRMSGIFPHVKFAMESIPSGKNEPTKFNYTTGAATQRNYIARKAGLKAEFHHGYGALLVEVSVDGWWCRQINADSTGTIYDLDVKVSRGKVTTGNRLEALTYGDIHVAQLDEVVAEATWGKGGLLDTTRPKYQFAHDVLDFFSGRSHHDIKNPHVAFEKHVSGVTDIRKEVLDVAAFFARIDRPWCKTICVDSNHHNHLGRWLREQDGRADPVNAEYWLEAQRLVYGKIRRGQSINILRDAIHAAGIYQFPNLTKAVNRVRFLDEDESFILCPDANGGIEGGMHGDQGPNGARGNPRTFARMGRKANTGHTHSSGITDGVYTGGTKSILAPKWTHGPGSWSHSDIATYQNGKRAILTFWGGRYRA